MCCRYGVAKRKCLLNKLSENFFWVLGKRQMCSSKESIPKIIVASFAVCHCLVVASRPSNKVVYLKDRSPQTIVRVALLRQVADQYFYLIHYQCTDTGPTSLSIDPSTPVPGRVVTGVPIIKAMAGLDLDTDPWRNRESNSGLPLWTWTPYR